MNGTSLTTNRGPTTTWFVRRQNIWRVAILVLLLAAILGPWTYSADGLPPAEWCLARSASPSYAQLNRYSQFNQLPRLHPQLLPNLAQPS